MRAISILIAGLGLFLATSCSQPAQTDTNKVVENIMARRSIRKYKAEPVSREILTHIMECGINAPNGQNKQSWEVRIVDNPQLLEEMSQAMADSHQGSEFAKGCFRGAPVMVFIARDLSYDFSAYDCGLMAQNIMLSAWSMGGRIHLPRQPCAIPHRQRTLQAICRKAELLRRVRTGIVRGTWLCRRKP